MPEKARQKKKSDAGRETRPGIPVAQKAPGAQVWFVYGLIPALVAFLTFSAFLPTLQNGFVNWDDGAFLLENPHYRGLSWKHLRWMFTTCYLGSCMHLNYLTYGVDYLLWGMNPVGYHLSSLLFHVANAVLFYVLSLRLFRLGLPTGSALAEFPIRLAAGFSALFFSLHPLQVEAVAWATGREIALAGFFFFFTLISYLKAAENASAGLSRWRWMGAAWIFYAMSLLSKETALTLPFALLILDVYPLRRLGGVHGRWLGSQVRGVWLEKIPFLLLALASGLKAVLAKEQSGTIYAMADYGLLPRFAQVLSSLAFYPWKTLLPTGLSPLYPLHPFTGLWTLPILFSGAFVLAVSAGLFIARRRWPAGLAAWLFYVVLLVPVSGIVAFGPYRVADRFSYLPSAGWPILAGAGLFYCWHLWHAARTRRRTWVMAQSFAVLLLISLATLTWNQTQIWHNSETLWRHALALDEKSSFAHNNLGLVFAERGALEQAITEFRRAVQIDPTFVEAHTNLGHFLALQGSSREAISHLRQALKVDPSYVNAQNTLGNVLAEMGESNEAIQQFRMALKKNPESAMVNYNLARVLARRGDLDEAIAHYRRSLEINPSDPDIHNNLGLLLVRQGSLDQAIEQFHAALRAEPGYAKAYFNLGKVLAQQDRLADAVQYFQQALRIQPAVAEIHENLARALTRQGKKEQAIQHYQEALRLSQSRSANTGGR